MKARAPITLMLTLNLAVCVTGTPPKKAAIGESLLDLSEANAIVETEEANARIRRKARTEALHSVQAEAEREIDLGNRKITLRRVAPPPNHAQNRQLERKATLRMKPATRHPDTSETAHRESVFLTLSATVYDSPGTTYSKLRLRHKDAEYIAWTNHDFRYQSGIGAFDANERSYSYFGFTQVVDREKEAEKARRAAELNLRHKSRWEAPPVAFDSRRAEYVLVTDDADDVPEEVYRQLDDFFAHYLEHEPGLKVRYHNNRLLNEARKQRRETNPPKTEDIVMNYSRISETPEK